MRLTANEKSVLNHLARNSYTPVNYGVPVTFEDTGVGVWTHSILDSSAPEVIKPRSLPGIVSSLVKKGLVSTVDDGKDSVTGMTEAGFNAWKAAYAADWAAAAAERNGANS